MSIKVISTKNAEHYNWGHNYDGWFLSNHSEITIIKERIPPGEREVNHYHNFSGNFYIYLKAWQKL